MTIDKPQGRIALWPAKEGVRYAMSGKVTLPVELLTELVVIAGDARSEVELGIVLWDNSGSSKPNAPRFSGYANLPAEPQQQAPKATPKPKPQPVQQEHDWEEVPF